MKNIGKVYAQKIAEELCSVQPMSDDACKAFFDLYKLSKTRKELEGFKPVSNMGLMWIKGEK
jgi:hypothetical protein